MGHGEEPLTATYKTQRPPWIGIWSDREYKGRPDWWKEPGLEDSVARSGKLRLYRARFREEDPDWYDPKVKDGESLAGPFGLDSKKTKNLTKKGDQPGELSDFQNKVYEGSHQFKSIAEKFGLSKEHPGLDVSPTMNDLINTPKSQLGRNAIITNSWYHFGPRFFDSPLNEGAFWKGLAAAKYAGILLAPYTILEIRALNTVSVADFSPRAYLKRYLQLAPFPLAVAFAWGFTLSAASTIRNKDDVNNHWFASAAVGSTVATMKSNIALGTSAAIFTAIIGAFWQYQRHSETGLQGMTAHPQSSGIWGGPLLWQKMQIGDADVPTTRY
uniref:NADH dehydrogenase [ubiquinone] 1 alpha subcomplex subunit 11 n=1 Tax=Caenorhabditis tropicalis TaxID=1561998 RepID=A0A1I7T7F5_9PELO